MYLFSLNVLLRATAERERRSWHSCIFASIKNNEILTCVHLFAIVLWILIYFCPNGKRTKIQSIFFNWLNTEASLLICDVMTIPSQEHFFRSVNKTVIKQWTSSKNDCCVLTVLFIFHERVSGSLFSLSRVPTESSTVETS